MARVRTPRGGPVNLLWPKTVFDVEPDEDQIRQDILLLQKKMGDYHLPLQYSKQIIIGDIKKAFLAEKDPRGPAWEKLSDRAKQVPRYGILRRMVSGSNARMYNNLKNRFNWGVTDEGVYLNQSRLPRNEEGEIYFPYHQQDDASAQASGSGVIKLPKAKLHGMIQARKNQLAQTRIYEGRADRDKQLTAKAAYDVSVKLHKEDADRREKLGLADGMGKLPRRRMIGPSPEAEKQIVKVFDAWAKDVITIYKRGGPHGVVVMSPRRGVKL